MKISLKQKLGLMLLIPFVAGLTFSEPTYAAEKKDKAAKRNALMMQKMKQEFEAEKATMQTQFDAQKKEWELKLTTLEEVLVDADNNLAASEGKVRQLSADLKKTSAEHTSTKATLTSTKAELEATKLSLADSKQQHQQALADLAFNDGQRKTLSTNLAQTSKSLTSCEDKNSKLYSYGKDLIKLYDSPSRYETAMRKESFLQLKRVELENMLQDNLDKLDESRVVSQTGVR